MKKLFAHIIILVATVPVFAQNNPVTNTPSDTVEPTAGIIFPVLFMAFLVFMLTILVKYFLDYRLKNKLIDRGMSEPLTAYLLDKNDREKQNEAIKLAILFCGIGLGLLLTYLTAPIHIHSLAMMAFSLGLSYLAYFFYLRRSNT
jgi:hypothetical protein